LRKIKSRLLDTAYAATHLGHVLSSDEQLRADLVLEQFLNLDAERRGWGIRWEVTRKIIGTERIERGIRHPRDFNVTRPALCLVELRPGAIDEAALTAHATKPVPYSLPWIFLWLLRLGLEPLVDQDEFRARAAQEYRRIRKNVVEADLLDIMDRIDRLDRDAIRDRKKWRDHHDGLAGHEGLGGVFSYALHRQGIESVVPTFWPMSRGVPRRQYHHISHIPLRDYSQPIPHGHIRNKSGGLVDTSWPLWNGRQKGGPVSYVLITPALEVHHSAWAVMPEPMQRTLERCGRLYRLNCWFDYLGCVPRDKRKASGAGFSHDAESANEGNAAGDEGARPDLAALEKWHEKRESDIRHAPQGGTVKISYPPPAIRHAELKREMVAYNDSHRSYWNNSNVRVLPNSELAALAGWPEREIYSHRFARGSLRGHLVGTLNIVADSVDNVERWKNSIEQKEMLNERKSEPEFGLVGANIARDGGDYRLHGAGCAETHLRTAAAISNRTGRPETRPR
jgi:hypothetical protein